MVLVMPPSLQAERRQVQWVAGVGQRVHGGPGVKIRHGSMWVIGRNSRRKGCVEPGVLLVILIMEYTRHITINWVLWV